MIRGKRKTQIENLIQDLLFENSVEFNATLLGQRVKLLDDTQILYSDELAPEEMIHYYTFFLADQQTTTEELLDRIAREEIVPRESAYEMFQIRIGRREDMIRMPVLGTACLPKICGIS